MYKNNRRLRKKGNILDSADAVFILLGVVITLFILYSVLTNFSTSIKSNNSTNISVVTDNFDSFKTNYLKGWDYGFLFLLVLLPIFSFIAARKIPSDPIFMIMTFFILGFILLISMIASNFYGAFLDVADFQTFVNDPNIRFIPLLMPKLLYYSIIYIGIVLVGLFTKPSTEI